MESEPDPLNPNFVPVTFHEIDHSEKFLPLQNNFTLSQIRIFKQEIQVIDNSPKYYKVTQRDIDKNKKGKDQIEVLVETMKNEMEFIEP